ncbi:unnamed protein product [Zymoseptoria tritici ST99CH_1E4]|uniref:CFEM domain-containing protein n=1 Tax=Zymoseptoria tritici ST99CH_1E4 TaxID=1276532 RepID=A0A2H1G3M4_ZYMTR|nr:unnamed protein product [Zymoseptoria tritici ST99CH_1E4]
MQFFNPFTFAATTILPLIAAQQMNIPSCASSPLLSVITDFGCQIEPRDCYCTKPEVVQSIASAVVPACSGAIDQAGISSVVSSFCAITATAEESTIDTTISKRTITRELTTTVDGGPIAPPGITDAATLPESEPAEETAPTGDLSSADIPSPTAAAPITDDSSPEDGAAPTDSPPSPTDGPSNTDEAAIPFTTAAPEAEISTADVPTAEEQPALTTASNPNNLTAPSAGDNPPPAAFTGEGNLRNNVAALVLALAGMGWVFAEL